MRTQHAALKKPGAPTGQPWSDRRWGAVMTSKEEKAELDRLRQGCVDEKGLRTVVMPKGDLVTDNPRLSAYEQRGYVVDESAPRHYRLSISQKEWQQQENERIAETMQRRNRSTRQLAAGFAEDIDEDLAPVDVHQLRQGAIPQVSGGTSIAD